MTDVRLDPDAHPWMTASATRALLEALNLADDDQARFVGGCVRNALLGAPVDDIDIATRLTPEIVVERLSKAGIKVVPTGLDHGTVTAVVQGVPFEVTSLRKDVEAFGRRAEVAFTTDWHEDALRRDFRLNAIYARPDGALFDPFDGIEDARRRQIIFIGEPNDRIAEDHLRILRFYRFTAWYGAALDPAGHQACVENAETLKALSVERVWKELKKLLLAQDPGPAVKAMQEGHVLKQVLSEDIDFNLFLSIIASDRGKSRNADALLRLAALLGRNGDAMRRVCEHMKASNAERARAAAMTAPAGSFGLAHLRPGLNENDQGLALYRMGPEAFADQMRLMEAAGEGEASADLEAAARWERPRFPISGKDLIAAGLPRGPKLGARLNELEQAWAQSGFKLSRDAMLSQAAQGAS